MLMLCVGNLIYSRLSVSFNLPLALVLALPLRCVHYRVLAFATLVLASSESVVLLLLSCPVKEKKLASSIMPLGTMSFRKKKVFVSIWYEQNSVQFWLEKQDSLLGGT